MRSDSSRPRRRSVEGGKRPSDVVENAHRAGAQTDCCLSCSPAVGTYRIATNGAMSHERRGFSEHSRERQTLQRRY